MGKGNFFLKELLSCFLVGLFIMFLGNTNNVFAYNQPTMSTQQAQLILDTLKNKDFNYKNAYGIQLTEQEKMTYLNSMQPNEFATQFNNKRQYIDYDFTWNDVTIFYNNGLTSNAGRGLTIDFIIAPNNYNNLILKNNYTNRYEIDILNNYKAIDIGYGQYGWNTMLTITTMSLYPKFELEISNGNINNLNCFISINNDRHIKFNSTDYTISTDILYFTDSGGIVTPEITPEDTESDYGYYFYDSQLVGAIPVNKLSLQEFYSLDEWWYIGDELNYTYNYYYYSGDEKISINNLITLNTSRNSGDTGSFYFPKLYRQQIDSLPNDTGFYLDISCSLGNDTVTIIEDFYSFYTFSEVVDSGATGVITNESGDITGGVDLTGIQVGLNNLNNNLTSQPDISNITISSGEIESSLGFELASNPYENFWLSFTNGFRNALTSNTKTYIDIDFLGYVYRYDLSNVHNPLPADLKTFISLICTALLTYQMLKEVKILVNDIQKGGIITTTSANALEDDDYLVYF